MSGAPHVGCSLSAHHMVCYFARAVGSRSRMPRGGDGTPRAPWSWRRRSACSGPGYTDASTTSCRRSVGLDSYESIKYIKLIVTSANP